MKFYLFLICLCVLTFLAPSLSVASVVNEMDPYAYQELSEDLEQLREKYGDVLSVIQIGKSHFGKPIWAIRLGEGKESILLIGAHHGREWISSNLLMMMMEHYADSYKEKKDFGPYDTSVFDKIAIWFVPMLNPDGVDVQQGRIQKEKYKAIKALNGGSKNFARWKANGVGIDLNRQYPAGWEELPSPVRPYYKFYKGKKPFEAKEVQALVQFVEEIKPQSAMTYHSTGQEIFWQYGEGQNLVRDYFIGERLSWLTGYPLARPQKEATGGGFTDWFISEYGRPSFTIELCEPQVDTNPPISELQNEWERNQYTGLLLANEMLNYLGGN